MIRIAMFSGPRNISTTMMRAFENRSDTEVVDEPFYACYLKASAADHPMREQILATQSADWRVVATQLGEPVPGGMAIQFEKHIAFHLMADAPKDWIKQTRPFHLIRDPRAMIASYAKKYTDVNPIIDSYRIQREIDERLGQDCPVVDARDVLDNPDGMLRSLCTALNIEFDTAMLSWPAGARTSDGVWAAHWYDAVVQSTGFHSYKEKHITLPDNLEHVAALCADDYDFFHKRRLKPA